MPEEAKLTVFDNRILRTIYGRIQNEDTGELRQRHNDELLTNLGMNSIAQHDYRVSDNYINLQFLIMNG